MSGQLISLALAAEARGKAQTHLARARVLADKLRADLDADAAALIQDAADKKIARARPGDQIELPTFEAAYAFRSVANERRLDWRPRGLRVATGSVSLPPNPEERAGRATHETTGHGSGAARGRRNAGES